MTDDLSGGLSASYGLVDLEDSVFCPDDGFPLSAHDGVHVDRPPLTYCNFGAPGDPRLAEVRHALGRYGPEFDVPTGPVRENPFPTVLGIVIAAAVFPAMALLLFGELIIQRYRRFWSRVRPILARLEL